MSGKTKLGRNPFSKKTAPAKARPAAAPKAETRGFQWEMMERLKKMVRFVSIDAPIGICFITYRAYTLTFRPAVRR